MTFIVRAAVVVLAGPVGSVIGGLPAIAATAAALLTITVVVLVLDLMDSRSPEHVSQP